MGSISRHGHGIKRFDLLCLQLFSTTKRPTEADQKKRTLHLQYPKYLSFSSKATQLSASTTYIPTPSSTTKALGPLKWRGRWPSFGARSTLPLGRRQQARRDRPAPRHYQSVGHGLWHVLQEFSGGKTSYYQRERRGGGGPRPPY